jgi:hypothetical protein
MHSVGIKITNFATHQLNLGKQLLVVSLHWRLYQAHSFPSLNQQI